MDFDQQGLMRYVFWLLGFSFDLQAALTKGYNVETQPKPVYCDTDKLCVLHCYIYKSKGVYFAITKQLL